MALPELLRLAGAAVGAVGGALLFVEFFQLPSYVSYDQTLDSYDVSLAPQEVQEHTWIGRVGAFGVSLGFALVFVGTLAG